MPAKLSDGQAHGRAGFGISEKVINGVVTGRTRVRPKPNRMQVDSGDLTCDSQSGQFGLDISSCSGGFGLKTAADGFLDSGSYQDVGVGLPRIGLMSSSADQAAETSISQLTVKAGVGVEVHHVWQMNEPGGSAWPTFEAMGLVWPLPPDRPNVLT